MKFITGDKFHTASIQYHCKKNICELQRFYYDKEHASEENHKIRIRNMIRKAVFCSFLILASWLNETVSPVDAKAVLDEPCPSIIISCLNPDNSCCGKKRIFGVGIAGGFKNPTCKWKVSTGEIIKGQGERTIEVEAAELNEPMEITVEVGNITVPKGCPTTVKYTEACGENCGSIRK